MALLIKIFLLSVIACATHGQESTGRGISQFHISDEQINMALNDRRYLRRQIQCVLGEAPCDPVGRRLKSLAPLVLRGSCPQCSKDESRQIKKVLAHVQRTFPKEEWTKIIKQYAGVLSKN
uniref:Chemosensory protein 5 n=1 Tax=Meteorus pulchricornis TaxID=51522 RepID=A0A1S5VFI8_9HYME|nr:chemosensory protein 5 [Meteorus pulchricornis]